MPITIHATTTSVPAILRAGAIILFVAAVMPVSGQAGIINTVNAGGFTFTNFDPTLPTGSAGSNANGISNTGQTAVTTVDVMNNPTFSNFAGTPNNTTPLNTGTNAIAFAINSAGNVVGTQNGAAFYLPNGGVPVALAAPVMATNAFGINDKGNIVGQYTTAADTTPGFVVSSATSSSFLTINAPAGPDVVNAQGINNNGLVVGFYLGTDGQVHGFRANTTSGQTGVTTGVAIADPVIPPVAGEPGATFVFSQILGINDSGIAAGYYGDSTTSQHGFLYNTNTGVYTFLDDPSEQFHNGVEVTQITGITNSGEISGFYTDANGAGHSFVGCPAGAVCAGTSATPEPGTLWIAGLGMAALAFRYSRRRFA